VTETEDRRQATFAAAGLTDGKVALTRDALIMATAKGANIAFSLLGDGEFDEGRSQMIHIPVGFDVATGSCGERIVREAWALGLTVQAEERDRATVKAIDVLRESRPQIADNAGFLQRTADLMQKWARPSGHLPK
jgi:hypothetical protein